MRSPSRLALVLPLAGALSCGASAERPLEPKGPPTSVSSAATTSPTGPCEQAKIERARVPELRREGKLRRALRVIRRADELCPAQAAETWAPLLSTLAELGLWDEVRRSAAQIGGASGASAEARDAAGQALERAALLDGPAASDGGRTAAREIFLSAMRSRGAGRDAEAERLFLRAWELARPNGQALIEAGLSAGKQGHAADAQRLFDRGGVELEATLGATMTVEARQDFGMLLAWSPEDLLVVRRLGRISVHLATTLEERLRLDGASELVALSPDGTRLATGATLEEPLRLWDLVAGRQIAELLGHAGGVRSLAFLPGGAKLASEDLGRARFTWDAGTGRLLARDAPKRRPKAAKASAPSKRARLTYWADPAEPLGAGEVVCGIEGRPSCPESDAASIIFPTATTLSRDGSTRATEWHRDLPGCLWQCPSYGLVVLEESATGRELGRLSPCAQAAFSPDGSAIVCSGGMGMSDAKLRLWSVARRERLAEVDGSSYVFSPSGDRLAVVSSEPAEAGPTRERVSFYRTADGAKLSSPMLSPDREATYVLTPDGHVDFAEPATRARMVCRIGPFVFPFEACEEGARVPGLLQKILADQPYLDP